MEPHTIQIIERFVKPGDSCIDAGAHVGDMSDALLKAAGDSGRLYLFEILGKNIQALQQRFKNNTNVVVIPKAVSNQTGTCQMFLSPVGSTFESGLLDHDMRDRPMVKGSMIPCIRIDDFMKDLLPRMNFIIAVPSEKSQGLLA